MSRGRVVGDWIYYVKLDENKFIVGFWIYRELIKEGFMRKIEHIPQTWGFHPLSAGEIVMQHMQIPTASGYSS